MFEQCFDLATSICIPQQVNQSFSRRPRSPQPLPLQRANLQSLFPLFGSFPQCCTDRHLDKPLLRHSIGSTTITDVHRLGIYAERTNVARWTVPTEAEHSCTIRGLHSDSAFDLQCQ